jgi:hypothetical protein
VLHGAPLLLWPVLHPGGWLALAVASTLFFSLVRSWRLQVSRQHPDAVCSLVWGAGKDCRLFLHSGRQEDVNMRAQAFILPWLVILQFNSRWRYLVLLPDMLDHQTFRRLRVRLRLEMSKP